MQRELVEQQAYLRGWMEAQQRQATSQTPAPAQLPREMAPPAGRQDSYPQPAGSESALPSDDVDRSQPQPSTANDVLRRFEDQRRPGPAPAQATPLIKRSSQPKHDYSVERALQSDKRPEGDRECQREHAVVKLKLDALMKQQSGSDPAVTEGQSDPRTEKRAAEISRQLAHKMSSTKIS